MFPATIGCLREGFLVFAPSGTSAAGGGDGETIPSMHSYVVTLDEIVQLRLVARLVVLSCGFGVRSRHDVDKGYILPSAFLAAGSSMWQSAILS